MLIFKFKVAPKLLKNADFGAVLMLLYSVNSVQATPFRQWATYVLKQYMLKGYVVNHNASISRREEPFLRGWK